MFDSAGTPNGASGWRGTWGMAEASGEERYFRSAELERFRYGDALTASRRR